MDILFSTIVEVYSTCEEGRERQTKLWYSTREKERERETNEQEKGFFELHVHLKCYLRPSLER